MSAGRYLQSDPIFQWRNNFPPLDGRLLRREGSWPSYVQFMGVLHTPPGTANVVAFAIDQSGWPEVLGTIAGDDTVIVITTDARARQRVEDRILARGVELDS